MSGKGPSCCGWSQFNVMPRTYTVIMFRDGRSTSARSALFLRGGEIFLNDKGVWGGGFSSGAMDT